MNRDPFDLGHQGTPSTEFTLGVSAGECVRDNCVRELGPEGEFCSPCRSFYLGDLEHDPATGLEIKEGALKRVAAVLEADPEALDRNLHAILAEALEGGPAQAVASGRAYLRLDSGELITGPEAAALVPGYAG